MSPPPPLGRARKRDAQLFDPALCDMELVEVRGQFGQGRWAKARTLLVDTADDWDRRGHRVLVLAETPTATAWAREWLLAEPDSADAATLLACATVFTALRRKGTPEAAEESCRRAASLLPADPTPWLGLLLLTRDFGTEEEFSRHFDQVRARHREHHHAHHLMVAKLAERTPGGGLDPLHEVYDFAAWAAEESPADSPLAVLPVIAHAERYRVLAAHGGPDGAVSHWSGRRARQVLRSAFDWWLEWERDDHPRNRVDLNFLAHAKLAEGRSAEAAALFHRIGRHATPAPWSYPDLDPHKAFLAARSAALGTA
ncbi:hypothetical protein ACFWHQ_11885 [Streptomyces sp. NPDC060334]|uniref:hypothetical protein n=1 Tax=unclassified Streptomyces TaxID=2593676 RepID=UPI0006AD9DEF|nr:MULTISPECIES: hypothetical protein [unclassified Streptomyces]KOU54351.1 hypothetical protein ADK55_14750 [Streptomyces sp. WM4235]MCX5076267.1 hypothetical protein [Streptomyces sp. NBC_00424]MCX5156307.1 hypothetical protein [Streptomyces sp. NBC_00291]WUD40688.1 hypothetical protein OHA84_09275 [Streptomyces sp. NBC_00513]